MYAYSHDAETGGLLLSDSPASFSKEPRPVYSRELDLLGFDHFWDYEKQDERPYLWAEANFYWYRGKRVARTTGGSLFERPRISLEESEDGSPLLPQGSQLEPVDMDAMVRKNSAILDALEKSTEARIYDVFQRYQKKLDCFHVAFSGGKDSIVLLELVKRALPSKDFLVVFGDTGMEFPDTYDLVTKVEEQCLNENIPFYRAQSHLSPQESWKIFGPPSQVLRWCCSVHKSVPQTLKIREVLGKKNYRGMDLVGIREHESVLRSTYKVLNFGKKQKGQYSFNSILEWSSAEVWLYIYYRTLPINLAYLKGNARVGCLCCPMGAGGKSDWFRKINYSDKVNKFITIIKESIHRDQNIDSYIKNNAWARRKNGRDLKFSVKEYSEECFRDKYVLSIHNPNTDWREWMKTLPEISFQYKIVGDKKKYTVEIPSSAYGTSECKLIRSIFHKAAFCVACRTCESNCPYGAISFRQGVHIENCLKCGSCHAIDDGCLAYHSLQQPHNGGHIMKSLNTMADHAPKIEWIIDFFNKGNYFFEDNNLGSMQVGMFKRFLSDSNLIFKNKTTSFYDFIKNLRYDSLDSWAIILVILVHSNPQIQWYIKNLPINEIMNAEQFEEKLTALDISKKDAASIRKAFGRLCDIQLGTKLKFGSYTKDGKIIHIQRKKTLSPDPRVFLYALYKFAEACDGYYEFTLSRLMDFSIESAGVSPAEIFGLSREETEQYLHGLARSNPDFLSFTTTHSLELIRLASEKKSPDILTLF